jgi:hypothetical protein
VRKEPVAGTVILDEPALRAENQGLAEKAGIVSVPTEETAQVMV